MKRKLKATLIYLFLIALALVMVYPLIWLFFATFKNNQEIFGSSQLLPSSFSFSAYAKGWVGAGRYTYTLFFTNSFKMVIPTVLFTVVSSTLVGYGFARFQFPMKKILFNIMLATLMLPNAVLIIPRYLVFRELQWLNTYLPFIVPAAFAGSAFFNYMVIQFMRGIPLDLDESAKIDGCNSFHILWSIILPLSTPALISVVIFQSLWTWNDFFNSLIYINSTKNFTVSLALRLAIDNTSATNWNQVLAMSLTAIMPCLLLFMIAQKRFVEGVATTGLKG